MLTLEWSQVCDALLPFLDDLVNGTYIDNSLIQSV